MFNTKAATTDELVDMLQWISDRKAYRRVCGIIDGTAYAEECHMENNVVSELENRKYFNWRA